MTAATGTLRSYHRVFDIVEQVTVAILYGLLVLRLWPNEFSPANWPPLLVLLSEGIVVVLLIIRRRTDRISMDARDWVIAFGATFLVLLVERGGEPLSTMSGGIVLLTGLCIQIGAKLSLGRSFGLVAADRGIQVRGLYAFVRHPMYAGYALSHVGYLLVAPTLWNFAVYAVAWSLFAARIAAEERVLGADIQYRTYKDRVRYRVVPGLF